METLDHDCLVHVVTAFASLSGPLALRELCRLAGASNALRRAVHEVLASLETITPQSFGPTPNNTAHRNPQLCVGGYLDVTAALSHCTGLRSLTLTGLHKVASDHLLRQVAISCLNLRDVTLDFCHGVTPAGLEALVSGAPHLRRLSLQRCDSVGDAFVLHRLKQLAHLDLTWCRNVELTALAGSCGSLRTLSLHGCELIGDEVCTQLPEVEELCLAFTPVTDEGLMALVAASPRLCRLILAAQGFNLWETGRWTDAGLAAFQQAAPHVEVSLVTC